MTEISLQDGNCPYDKNEINKQIKMWLLFANNINRMICNFHLKVIEGELSFQIINNYEIH